MEAWPLPLNPPSLRPSFSFEIVFTGLSREGFWVADHILFLDEALAAWCDCFGNTHQAVHVMVTFLYVCYTSIQAQKIVFTSSYVYLKMAKI